MGLIVHPHATLIHKDTGDSDGADNKDNATIPAAIGSKKEVHFGRPAKEPVQGGRELQRKDTLRKQQTILSTQDRVVNLQDLVRDVHEYHGVSELGYFLFYFALANMVLFMHWSWRLPVLKASIQTSFQGYGDPPAGSAMKLDSVQSMYEGARYCVLYAESFIGESELRKLPNETTQIYEYAEVGFMRLSAALVENCLHEQLFCAAEGDATDFNASGLWQIVTNTPGVSLGDMVVATIIGEDISTRNASLARLTQLQSDLAFLGKYAYLLSLDLVAVNQFSSLEVAYASLMATREKVSSLSDGPDQKVETTSISSNLPAGLYVTPLDRARAAVEVMFIVMNLYYIMRWIDCAFLAYQQFNGINGIWRYLGSYWAKVDLVSFLYTAGWCWWYIVLVLRDQTRAKSFNPYTATSAQVNEQLEFGLQLEVWLYAGIISNLLIGIRMLKYMQLHASLRIYARTLSKTWKTLRDFLVFFLYILLLMGTGVLAFFQISGGNPRFVSVQDALQAMALLTFGFMEYSEFDNGGMGIGTWQPIIIIVFWLVVVSLIVISQNIVLSIVVCAYEESKATEPFIEASLMTLLFHRISFDCRRLYARLRTISIEEFVEERVELFHHELFLHGTGLHGKGLFPTYLHARWAIALLPEARMVCKFFRDEGAQKYRKHSRWDAAFVAFEEVKHTNLIRSFGTTLNKVQGSKEVTEQLLAATAPDGTDMDSYGDKLQHGQVSRGSVRMPTLLSSLKLKSSLLRMQTPRVQPTTSDSAGGNDSNQPAKDDGGGTKEAGDAQSGAHVAPHSFTPSGRVVPASTAGLLDRELLDHLLTVIIPANERFTRARHVVGLKVSKFDMLRVPLLVDSIMRVYSFPRKSAGSARGNARATAADVKSMQRDIRDLITQVQSVLQPSGPAPADDDEGLRSSADLGAWTDSVGSFVDGATNGTSAPPRPLARHHTHHRHRHHQHKRPSVDEGTQPEPSDK